MLKTGMYFSAYHIPMSYTLTPYLGLRFVMLIYMRKYMPSEDRAGNDKL